MAQSPISSPQAVSLAPDGTVEWAQNADSLDYSIWSVTKTFTAYYGLQSDGSQITDIDATRTYFGGGTVDRLAQGDVVSVRDIYYATMMQSNNGAADNIGYATIADPSPHASHLGPIVDAMEAWYAAEFGWTGFHFSSLSGLGGTEQNRASARMVAELLRAVRMNQPVLHGIMRTAPDHTFTVGGPNPRSITVTHTLADDAATIPQWDGGKSGSSTGTGATYAAGVLWVDGDGGTHTLAVLGAPSASARSADIATIIGDVLDDMGLPTDIPVTANVPTADDTVNTISWTPLAGVQYVIGGSVRTPPYSVGDVTTSVTVTAQATTGYVLQGTSSWTFSFTGSDPDPSGLFTTDGSPIVLHLTSGDPITLA